MELFSFEEPNQERCAMQVTLAQQIEFLNNNATFVAVQSLSGKEDDTGFTHPSLLQLMRQNNLYFIRINEPKSPYFKEYKNVDTWTLGFILDSNLVSQKSKYVSKEYSRFHAMPYDIQFYLKQYAACFNRELWNQFKFHLDLGIPIRNVTEGMCYRRVQNSPNIYFDTQQRGASFMCIPEQDRLDLYYGDFPCKV